jgi:hypothetical protein
LREIPASVALIDETSVARRRRRGLVLIPLRRIRVPHLAEPSAALRGDRADHEQQRGAIDPQLLHETQEERELRSALGEELREKRHQLDRIWRPHVAIALRVARRTAS